jgi:hypothetical protein
MGRGTSLLLGGANTVTGADQKSAASARLRPIYFDVIGQSEH